MTAAAALDTGEFTGYLAGFGRDGGGDTITGPDAVAETVRAVNSGEVVWHITDSHSQRASDVVATVTGAAIDSHGVRIDARWAPTERAQQLRQMVRGGHPLGLSIDYYVEKARPDGRGGRYLDRIVIAGGAVMPFPMNAQARITEGKTVGVASGAPLWAPIVPWLSDAQEQAERAERNDPRRRAEDRILAASDWPPRDWPREIRLELIEKTAAMRAMREAGDDPVRARRQAKRDRDNRYSAGLARFMAEARAKACGHASCIGRCVYG